MNKIVRLWIAVVGFALLAVFAPMNLAAQSPTETPTPAAAPSGAGTLAVPGTPGTPGAVITGTLTAPGTLITGTLTAPSTPRAIGTPSAFSTPVPTPFLTSQNIGDKIPFSLLGFVERSLRGPFDATSVSFNLPADWQLDPTKSQVQITFNVMFSGTGSPMRLTGGATAGTGAPPRGAGPSSGTLEVQFNGVMIGTIFLDRDGERTVTLPLTPESLTPNSRTGRHGLTVSLNASVDCDFDWHTTVVVRASSQFILPHQFVSPTTDLKRLPRPLYQNSFVRDVAYLVLPDNPTAVELQSALDIAAGFGRMSLGKFVLNLVTLSQLTPEIQKAYNLVFVGSAANLSVLNGVPLPAPLAANGFAALSATPDDGIVQLAVSPWNPLRAILIASGNNDAAVNKAAQAVSTGVIKVTTQVDLALVSEVRTDLVAAAFATDRTLAALGYPNTTLQEVGTNLVEFRFYMPPAQTVASDAYFDLFFNHSALVEFDKSGMLISLNDEPIGSARFTEDTAKQGAVRIPIPKSSVRPGVNRLVVQADLYPRFVCADPRFALLWLTIRNESLLHLPTVPMTETDTQRVIDLTAYPNLFTLHPTLSTIAFVLPHGEAGAWNAAAQIAADLGNNSAAAMADFVVVYGDAVPDTLRASRDLLIVGRPSTLPFITELRDVLPAPFEAGSDLATERNVRVVYRIPPGANVGYLELAVAPWRNDRVIFGVLGSTTQGLAWSSAAIITPRSRGQLSGNYAFINGEQIVVGDSRAGLTTTGVAQTVVPGGGSATPVVLDLNPVGTNVPDPRPTWILPVLGASLGLMVLVVLIVGISGLFSRRRVD